MYLTAPRFRRLPMGLHLLGKHGMAAYLAEVLEIGSTLEHLVVYGRNLVFIIETAAMRCLQMDRKESLDSASKCSLSVNYKVQATYLPTFRARRTLGSPHGRFETAFEKCGEMCRWIIDDQRVISILLWGN